MENRTILTRNKTMDCFKGMLIILVVIRHVLQFSVTDEGGILSNVIWAVQMPGFIIISGYFSARTISSLKEIFGNVKKNASHYALPFFSWFILIDVFLLGKYNRNVVYALTGLAKRVDTGLWFLWVIFILSILFTICNYFFSMTRGIKRIVTIISTCVVFWGILFAVGMICRDFYIFGIQLSAYYFPFYLLGWGSKWCIASKHWNIDRLAHYKAWMLSVCFTIFVSIVFNFELYRSGGMITVIFRYIAGVCGSVVLFHISSTYTNILERIKIHQIGRYTLEIYVTHMYFNNLFMLSNNNIFWSSTGFFNFVASFICTCIFTIITIAVCKSMSAVNFIMFGKKSKGAFKSGLY